MQKIEFIKTISSIPNIGKQTAARIYENGITSLDDFDNMGYEKLTSIGISPSKSKILLAHINSKNNFLRLPKGFDAFYDPSELPLIIVVCLGVIFPLIFSYFKLMDFIPFYHLLLNIPLLFFTGMYWITVFINVEKSEKPFYFSLAFLIMYLLSTILLHLLGIEYVELFQDFNFAVFLFWFITWSYFVVYRYKASLNIKYKSIDIFSTGVIFTSVIFIIILLKKAYAHLNDEFGLLFILEFTMYFLSIIGISFNLLIAYLISSKKGLPKKNNLLGLYIIAFLIGLFLIVNITIVKSNDISLAILLFIETLIPSICLWFYILYPNNHYPQLSRIFVILIIFSMIFEFLIGSDLINRIFVFETNSFNWGNLKNIGLVLQIASLLFFSGGLFKGFLKFKTINYQIKEVDIREAGTELLKLETFSRHSMYYDLSNLCYQHLYYSIGIEFLKNSLSERKWKSYQKATIYYQLACGYSLLGNIEEAKDYLQKSINLYSKFKTLSEKDNMLNLVR